MRCYLASGSSTPGRGSGLSGSSHRLILGRASDDVIVTGLVDDVRPYIERAAVVIVPLRIGGGTRLKIVEAMAMGKPIVATRLRR